MYTYLLPGLWSHHTDNLDKTSIVLDLPTMQQDKPDKNDDD